MAVTIFGITFGTRNVAAAEFTYAQRIELGKIFGDEQRSEYRRLVDAYKVLYGYSPRWLPFAFRYRRLQRLLEDFGRWIEIEQAQLDYKPDAAEIAAGVEELGKRIGAMGTLKALAKAYSTQPDKVLRWGYATVFGILYTDLQEYYYNKRLTKEREKEAKKQQKGGKNGR